VRAEYLPARDPGTRHRGQADWMTDTGKVGAFADSDFTAII
jgi:hypothetical protein